MSSTHPGLNAFLWGLLLILVGRSACADQVYNVTVDTSNLVADYTGPFRA